MQIEYICGSRADYGLMERSLLHLAAAPNFDLSLVLTGQALLSRYGDVESAVMQAGLSVAHRIPVSLNGKERSEMARAFAAEAEGFARYWSKLQPDLVMLLGDRSEMLAAASIAHHFGIATVHLHGGERSGTIDDAFRHAISKLAAFHFVASEDSKERLLKMGEPSARIYVVGAPGLVGLTSTAAIDKTALCRTYRLSDEKALAVLLFHPVVQEDDKAAQQFEAILLALEASEFTVLALRPNSDSGGQAINTVLDRFNEKRDFTVLDHLAREDFLDAIRVADLMVGNSSSGIIESASLGTACVNIGTRQNTRLRNTNTVECVSCNYNDIYNAIQQARELRPPFRNAYEDKFTNRKIVAALNNINESFPQEFKEMTY